MDDYLRIIAEDRLLISYRPSLNAVTGSVVATIFLQQCIYWWVTNGKKPFFKFSAPCEHEQYRAGDSWQEELGFTRSEFETARNKVGIKRKKGEGQGDEFITYWADQSRRTWYMVNESAIAIALKQHYLLQDSRNSNCRIPAIDNKVTENNAENNTEKGKVPPKKTGGVGSLFLSSGINRKRAPHELGFEAIMGNEQAGQLAKQWGLLFGYRNTGSLVEHAESFISMIDSDKRFEDELTKFNQILTVLKKLCKPVKLENLIGAGLDCYHAGFGVEQIQAVAADGGEYRTKNRLRDAPFPSSVRSWIDNNLGNVTAIPVVVSPEAQEFHKQYIVPMANQLPEAAVRNLPRQAKVVMNHSGLDWSLWRKATPEDVQQAIDAHKTAQNNQPEK